MNQLSPELKKQFEEAALSLKTEHPQPSLQRDFLMYHLTHPEVYVLIVKFAREVKAAGFNSYGMASIVERLRWHYNVEQKGKKFAMRDGYNSRYARLVMKTCPDLQGFFHIARLKTK